MAENAGGDRRFASAAFGVNRQIGCYFVGGGAAGDEFAVGDAHQVGAMQGPRFAADAFFKAAVLDVEFLCFVVNNGARRVLGRPAGAELAG